jgi:hypothetical protein
MYNKVAILRSQLASAELTMFAAEKELRKETAALVDTTINGGTTTLKYNGRTLKVTKNDLRRSHIVKENGKTINGDYRGKLRHLQADLVNGSI